MGFLGGTACVGGPGRFGSAPLSEDVLDEFEYDEGDAVRPIRADATSYNECGGLTLGCGVPSALPPELLSPCAPDTAPPAPPAPPPLFLITSNRRSLLSPSIISFTLCAPLAACKLCLMSGDVACGGLGGFGGGGRSAGLAMEYSLGVVAGAPGLPWLRDF